jgi:hypothetical protein
MENGWNLSVCGLNCAVCDIMLAGKGDQDRLKEILDWFKEERGLDVEPEDIVCMGCRGSLDRHWSPDCGMMLCARSRGHDYCFQCSDFVCEKLEAFAGDGMDHHRRAVENMKRIMEMGLDAWLEEQRGKGPPVFCP